MLTTSAMVATALAAWMASRLVDRRPGTPSAQHGRRCVHLVAAALAALLVGAVAAVVTHPIAWVPFIYLAITGVPLARIDAYELRLPDRLVLPAYPLTAGCFCTAAALADRWGPLTRAVVGGVLLWGFYRLLRALRPGELGRGDVKLAGVLGAQLAWLGWGSWQVGALLSFVLFIAAGVVGVVLKRATWRTRQAFGPYMLIGALAAVCGLTFTS